VQAFRVAQWNIWVQLSHILLNCQKNGDDLLASPSEHATFNGMTTKPPISFEPFQPDDAEQVTRLFIEVYGDAYPIRRVYDPQQLIEAANSDSYLPFVARSETGQVISYAALCRSAPYKGIYELVQGIVSSDFRGGGVGRAMFEHVERLLTTLPDAETYFGESVCNHLHTQKACAHIKSIDTALELDLMPGEIYARDTPDTGRIAVLDSFRSFVSKPHQVYVPQRYEEIIRYLYDGFDDQRALSVSTVKIPAGQRTTLSVKWHREIGLVRLAVTEAGEDFTQQLDAVLEECAGQEVQVIQLWLKSSLPWTGDAVEQVRERGFFFGGIFPRWFDDDGIMLQKIAGRPHWEGIHLHSDRALKIRDVVYADWLRIYQCQ